MPIANCGWKARNLIGEKEPLTFRRLAKNSKKWNIFNKMDNREIRRPEGNETSPARIGRPA
jgi:hypothetical protein